MPRINVNQTNFTGGELTPRMKGRGDVARYQTGAETIENGKVLVHGGIVRREGLRYTKTAKLNGAQPVRLIRYVFNVDQAYMLEFGHNYIRFQDAATGAVLLDAGLSTLEIASPYTAAQLRAVRYKQDGDRLYLWHPDVPQQILRRLSPTAWSIAPVVWAVQPFAELGHVPAAKLSLSASSVGVGRTFTTAPATAPSAPTIGTAFPLNTSASVNFTAPANNGGLPITGYTATSNPGGFTATGPASPLRVNGLTNGVAYTFTVTATNGFGTSAASAVSNAVTPQANLQAPAITVTADNLNFSAIVENGEVAGIPGPTASGSGGTAPYTFAWAVIGPSPAAGVERADTAQPLLFSTNYGATNYLILRCTGTDALGAQGSVDVNIAIRHRSFDGVGGGGGGEYVP